MASSIFDDKSKKPDANSLNEILGTTAKLWTELREHLEKNYGPITEDWKFYNQKSGWLLKLLRKKRNLFFFIPWKDSFKITFVFGDKAVSVVEQSDLPEDIKNTLKNARKYAEGRGIQIEVNQPQDIENIKKLVEIKHKN